MGDDVAQVVQLLNSKWIGDPLISCVLLDLGLFIFGIESPKLVENLEVIISSGLVLFPLVCFQQVGWSHICGQHVLDEVYKLVV